MARRHPAQAEDKDRALHAYLAKRDPARTPEPMGDERARDQAAGPIFVVQEHDARALHWDFRLEHGGVLVSWALPKGVPEDPQANHLAVHTEDHPMSYGSFQGEIPAGQYGAGTVRIWDVGTYELEKWTSTEVKIVLHGARVSGRYVLFATKGNDWMIHRMDPPATDLDPFPTRLRPMLATADKLPTTDDGWAYEIKWDGVRAMTYVDGGRIRMQSRNDQELSGDFPELRTIGDFFGSRRCILDGEIVALGENAVPDFGRLQHRLHLSNARTIKQRSLQLPASYVAFDLLYLDDRSLLAASYDQRREQLERLHFSGDHFTTGVSLGGLGGADALKATRQAGLEGVVAKRRDAPYTPGRRSAAWIKIKNLRTQEVVIGGWTDGEGNRKGSIGALLLGVPEAAGLRYVGKVGTGFDGEDRRLLLELLERVRRKTSPFLPSSDVDASKPAHFVSPRYVGEVQFSGWTAAARLRQPIWRGIRSDKKPADVVLED